LLKKGIGKTQRRKRVRVDRYRGRGREKNTQRGRPIGFSLKEKIKEGEHRRRFFTKLRFAPWESTPGWLAAISSCPGKREDGPENAVSGNCHRGGGPRNGGKVAIEQKGKRKPIVNLGANSLARPNLACSGGARPGSRNLTESARLAVASEVSGEAQITSCRRVRQRSPF